MKIKMKQLAIPYQISKRFDLGQSIKSNSSEKCFCLIAAYIWLF